jgi:hypothetical protein
MSTISDGKRLLAGGALSGLVYAAIAAGAGVGAGVAEAQQKASPRDFSSGQVGWLTFRGEFIPVPGGPSPLRTDPAHPNVGNNTGAQPTYRIGDLGNPNLKPWVKERMKKDNDEVLAGKIAFTPRSSCTERWKLTDGGKVLEATVRVEDPDTFNEPWSGIQRYDRVERPMIEEVCAENNLHLFNYGVPVVDKPDF